MRGAEWRPGEARNFSGATPGAASYPQALSWDGARGQDAESDGPDDLPSLAALRVLEALSRHKRIGIAAVELGVSHAAVSRMVSRLELKYGLPLFERTSWGVEATPGCEGLIQAYLSASASLRRALSQVRQGRRCHVLIPLTAWRWLSPATSRLRATLPDVSIEPCQDSGPIDSASADFAIVPTDRLPAAGFETTPLYDERLIPVCAPGLAQRLRLETPARLAQADLIVERPELWRRWFSAAGLAGEPALAGPLIADPSLAIEAALSGQGVALSCSLATAAAVAQGALVTPVDVSVSSGRRWWAIWRQGPARDETAMGVLEWCLAELHSIRTAHADIA